MSAVPDPATITEDDISRLEANASPPERCEIAIKTARVFDRDGLPQGVRDVALGIVRALARDVDAEVRAALSESLKHSPRLPHDVAVALANDVERVALPVLEFSSVLTDEDLIEVIACQGREAFLAIARRAMVSADVAGALIGTGEESVALTVVSNDGAVFAEETLHEVLDRYGGNEAFQLPIARRPNLPAGVISRMMDCMSERVRDYLVTQQAVPAAFADEMLLQARERALIGILTPDSPVCDVEDLVDRLRQSGRISPTLLLRALFQGDLHFFETAVAALAGVPVDNARKLIYDRGPFGLRALLRNTAVPDDARKALRTAVRVVRKTRFSEGAITREDYVREIVQRLLPGYDVPGPEAVEAYLSRFATSEPAG